MILTYQVDCGQLVCLRLSELSADETAIICCG